jgi:hypothetical protein
MANTLALIAPPAYIAATATNIYTPATTPIYTIIRHIHVANITAGAVSFNLCVSTTGNASDGKNLFKGQSVAANSTFDYYCTLRMLSTNFLVGLDGNGAALVITVEGEFGVILT